MKKGFTLAEILVTLAIIGIVAALTIPTLVKGYQKKVLATQLEKAYNQFMTAFTRSLEDEGVDSIYDLSWRVDGNYRGEQFFKKYLNTDIICNNDNLDRCLGTGYAYTTEGDVNFGEDTPDDVVSALGMNEYGNQPICGVLESGATICVAGPKVLIDVNGKDNPNRMGMDLYYFSMSRNGDRPNSPTYGSSTYDDVLNGERCRHARSGYKYGQCFIYVMSNGWKIK